MGILYDWLDKCISVKEIFQCYDSIISFWKGVSSKLGFSYGNLETLSIELNLGEDKDRKIYEVHIVIGGIGLVRIQYDMYTGSCKILEGVKETESVLASKEIKGYLFNIIRTINSLKHSPTFVSLVNSPKNEAYVYQEFVSIHASISDKIKTIDKIIVKNANSAYLKEVMQSSGGVK